MKKYKWILIPSKGLKYEALSAKSAAEYLQVSPVSIYYHWKTRTPLRAHLIFREEL